MKHALLKKTMMKYLVSYDLTNAEQADYDAMDKKIKCRIDKDAERILQSQWIVDTNFKKAEDICIHLENNLGSQGQLLVICLDLITDIAIRNITSQKLR